MRRISLAAATLLVAAMGAAPAFAADRGTATDPAPVPLSIPHYAHMLVDAAHGHVFFSEGFGQSAILVTDFNGTKVGEIDNEPGAYGITLSPDGRTLYAALGNGDAVSAIDTSTLTETARYSLGTGSAPLSVAWAGGKLWVGYGGATHGNIGSIDPSTTPATVVLAQAAQTTDWYAAPLLASSPAAPGVLLATDSGTEPPYLERYDVSSGKLVTGVRTWLQNSSTVASWQITPDGKDVVIATGAPYYHQVLKVADLSADGVYNSTNYPNSVAIAPDGFVAAGSDNPYSNQVYVYAAHGAMPLNTYALGGATLVNDGLAWAPDGSRLFAITGGVYGDNPTLHILTAPESVSTSLTLTGPGTATRGAQLSLTGRLSSTGTVPAGTVLHVTRTDMDDPSGVGLPDVVTAADGSFTVTDTPQVGAGDTYQVSFPGNARLGASAATTTVQVSRATPGLSITTDAGAYAFYAPAKVTVHLGPTHTGRAVTVYATNSQGTLTVATGTVDQNGDLVVHDRIIQNTTFSASYAGDDQNGPATATSQPVLSHALLIEAQHGYYRSGLLHGVQVRYYHSTAHPVLAAGVAPNKAGACLRFVLQEYAGGGVWKTTAQLTCAPLNAQSVAAAAVALRPNTAGHFFRFAAEFVQASGDVDNISTWGAWQYFVVTK